MSYEQTHFHHSLLENFKTLRKVNNYLWNASLIVQLEMQIVNQGVFIPER